MSLVLDTSFAIALYSARDTHHERARGLYELTDEDFVTTPLVLAELEFLLGARREVLWADLDRGAWTVRWWADATRDAAAVARRHPWIGLTDASLVALARVLRTTRIATFDDQFRSLTTPDGQPLTVLPD